MNDLANASTATSALLLIGYCTTLSQHSANFDTKYNGIVAGYFEYIS